MNHLGKLAALGLTALIAAWMSAAPAGAKDIKIGIVNLSLCCSYFVGMDLAIKDEAKAYPNITVISTDAEGDAAKLTANVEDLLSQKVDGLIVSAAWIEAAPEALDAIKAASVPVVLVDRMLKGGDFTSWIGPDNYAIGVGVGKYIVDRTKGQGLVAVLRGGPADNSIGLAPHRRHAVGSREGRPQGREGARFWRLERRWRLQAHGGHADQVPRYLGGLLRERLDVPGRSEGDQGRRP